MSEKQATKKLEKAYQKAADQITIGLDPLETELMKFIELVQSSMDVFDLRYMRVIKRKGKAYFSYMGKIEKQVPLEYIEKDGSKQ